MSDDLRDPRTLPPAIEPLGDLTWARIERAVWAELDAAEAPVPVAPARSRRWGIALGLAGAAVAAAAVIAVVAVTGTRAAPPAVAVAPEWVVTDVGSSRVTFGDARIVVAPRSAV